MNNLSKKEQLIEAKKNAQLEVMEFNELECKTWSNLRHHLRRYVLFKFLLSIDCEESSLEELSRLSVAETMKIDKAMVKEIDMGGCDGADSVTTKKVLLFLAIQRDFGVVLDPDILAGIDSIEDFSDYVFSCLEPQ